MMKTALFWMPPLICVPPRSLLFILASTESATAQYVLHAHPVFSTIWSMQNQELPLYTESAKLKLVHVPLIPDGQPGSVDLAEKVLTAVSHTSEDTTAFLMEAHGVLILGETMENCFHQAELLEDSAKIAVFQKLLHP